MGRRGKKRQLDLECEYWRLLQSGIGTVAACRTVGITRKTGYRWRAENGGLPPARLAESARSGRYLSLLERQGIATLRERGHGVREIAGRLGRSPSTISRELRRNLRPHDPGLYDGDLAHARAVAGHGDPGGRCSAGIPNCNRSSRPNSNCGGVRRRSPHTCARRILRVRTGTCATKPCTRRSTTVERAA